MCTLCCLPSGLLVSSTLAAVDVQMYPCFMLLAHRPCGGGVGVHQFTAQQTRDVDSMLLYCWSSVADGGPTLKQH